MKLDSITFFSCDKVTIETDPDNNCLRVILVDADRVRHNATITVYGSKETVPEYEMRSRATCCDFHRYGERDRALPCVRNEEPDGSPDELAPSMMR